MFPLIFLSPLIPLLVYLFGKVAKFFDEKHCWVVMGDADSGKTEFLCMLQDMERDPKGKTKRSHAGIDTPASTTNEVEVLNQTIVFCDGPGAIKRKTSRMHWLLNGPVKEARAKKQRIVLLYMVDMKKLTNDDDRKKACNVLFAEVGMFLKGFEQLCKNDKYDGPGACAVSHETLKAAGGKIFVIGTHMDIVRNNIRKQLHEETIPIPDISIAKDQMECESLIRVVDELKMRVPLSPFMKDLTFEFVFGDIFSHKGRCEFFKEFAEKLSKLEEKE